MLYFIKDVYNILKTRRIARFMVTQILVYDNLFISGIIKNDSQNRKTEQNYRILKNE